MTFGLEPSASKKRSLLYNLDQIVLGPWDKRNQHMQEVRKTLITGNIGKFEAIQDLGAKFNRRITYLCWHSKFPFLYAAGSKFGDIVVGTVEKDPLDSRRASLQLKAEVTGAGAGGSITAMKFDNEAMNILYRSSIDCKVSRIDLENPLNSLVYYDTGRYEEWFTSMDVNFSSKIVASGDCKGNMYFFNLDGKKRGVYQLHKSKIHHVEFSKRNPDLFVTAGTAEKGVGYVKLWDIRKINLQEPLFTLPHESGVSTAHFSPIDGSKLLTTDQGEQIRVYQGPMWKDMNIIEHHHKQFQHLTPIKAEWHPLADLIVIGKYPKRKLPFLHASKSKPEAGRTVEFYDPDSQKLVAEITPPVDQIVSLNVFNPTGEYLASGCSSKLILWKPSFKLDELGTTNTDPDEELSQDLQNKLRGKSGSSGRKQNRREYSPAGSEEENEDDNAKKPKRQRKVASASTTSTVHTRATRSNNQPDTTATPKNVKKAKDEKKGSKK